MPTDSGFRELVAESCRVAAWAWAGGHENIARLALTDAVEFLRTEDDGELDQAQDVTAQILPWSSGVVSVRTPPFQASGWRGRGPCSF